MQNHLNNKHFILFLLFICFPFFGVTPSNLRSSLRCVKASSYPTDFNISSVDLSFFIQADGTYYCTFSASIFGSNQTADGFSRGLFIIPDPTVTNFTLYLADLSLDLERRAENASLAFSFVVPQSIPQNLKVTMRGSFYGNLQSNVSGIHSYSLGFDWGTPVGVHTTIIRLKFREFRIVEITPPAYQPIIDIVGEYFELQWHDFMLQQFSTQLTLQSTETPVSEILIFTPPSPWNVTAGERFEILVKNIAIFDVEVFLITPPWITSNVSKLFLKPDQMIGVTLRISSRASRGMNDSIQFLIPYYSPLSHPVYVVRTGASNNLFFILVLTSFISVGAIISFFYRENLQVALRKVHQSLKSFRGNSINSADSLNSLLYKTAFTSELAMWDSIKTCWEPILPANEFKVIETLFFNGTLNQQTIAEELDMSQMTVSRLVSRLESKQLLTKKRLGMSNMIKLNVDRLLVTLESSD